VLSGIWRIHATAEVYVLSAHECQDHQDQLVDQLKKSPVLKTNGSITKRTILKNKREIADKILHLNKKN